MRHRRILIIHQSMTLRDLLRRFLLSELSDVDLQEAETGAEAMKILHAETYEAVICGNEMDDISGSEVYENMVRNTQNEKTPFLLLTSSPSPDNLLKFKAQGIDHVLGMPFSAKMLAKTINALCDPREWREHDRLYIPGARATIHSDTNGTSIDFHGDVVNISHGGILCDIRYNSAIDCLFSTLQMHINFPEEYGSREIAVDAQFLRMSVQAWKDGQPEAIRTAWKFSGMDNKNKQILEEIFTDAQDQLSKLEQTS